MRMWSQRRIAPVALASMTLATGRFNPDVTPEMGWQGTATDSDSIGDDTTGVTSPISTVTGDTSVSTGGDPSTGGTGSSGTSEGGTKSTGDTDPTGDAIDTP